MKKSLAQTIKEKNLDAGAGVLHGAARLAIVTRSMTQPIINKQCAELFKALADETRLKILHSLFEREQCVSELMASLHLAQPHVSHHLKILKVAGLVEASRDGQRICYALRPSVKDSLSQTKAEALNLGCCEVTFLG